jgi:hypothetical protein
LILITELNSNTTIPQQLLHNFHHAIFESCDATKDIDDSAHFNMLFPNVDYNEIPIKSKVAKMIGIIENPAAGEENKIQEEEENKNAIKIVDDYYDNLQEDTHTCYQELVVDNKKIIKPIVILHTADTTKKVMFSDSLMKSALDHLISTFNLTEEQQTELKTIMELNLTLEEIKTDETFNNLPFLVKVNDNSYAAYTKKYYKEVNPGRLYNTYNEINEIKFVGTYATLLL